MSASLKSLPPDAFAYITPCLTSIEIGRLILCGDRQLHRNILHKSSLPLLRLNLKQISMVRKFPNLSIFAGLRTLYIGDGSNRYCFQNLMAAPLAHLPVTLEHIELHFVDAERWFLNSPSSGPSPSPLVSEEATGASSAIPSMSFPLLKILVIDGSASSRFFNWNMPHVAPALEELSLNCVNGVTEAHALQLPQTLTKLEMERNATLVPASFHVLPRSLRSLTLNPRIYSATYIRAFVEELKHLSSLPPTLTSFSMAWMSELDGIPEGCAFNSMQLTDLTVVVRGEISEVLLTALPPTLRHLRLKYTSSEEYRLPCSLIRFLPPNLESMSTVLYDSATLSTLQNLPASLTKLRLDAGYKDVGTDGAEMVANMPVIRNLTVLHLHLSWSKNFGFFVNHLPDCLVDLSLNVCMKNVAQVDGGADGSIIFPESLETLRLSIDPGVPSFTPPVFTGMNDFVLPQRKLRTLNLLGAFELPRGWVRKQFSTTLKTVHLAASNWSTCLSELPRGITSLRLSGYDPKLNDEILFRGLPPALEVLDLFGDPLSNRLIPWLPRSITHLTLRCIGNLCSEITEDCFQHLPPHLSKFVCDGAVEVVTAWARGKSFQPGVIVYSFD